MTSPDDAPKLVAPHLYSQAYADLENLQMQLPEEAVVSLAQEVIRRLAKKIQKAHAPQHAVSALSQALISSDAKTAAALLEQHYLSGVGVRDLYLQYISPAAAQLGRWWEKDEVSFADVTIGIGRVYAIMRNLSGRLPQDVIPKGKTALFASVPGDDHILGLKIAAELAREEGWHIDLQLDTDHDALVSHIASAGHHLIGLSGGGEHALSALARLVFALRVSEPNALILVSGNIVNEAADRISLMHVDAISADFEEAMLQLNRLWTQIATQEAQVN
ncbi:MAG: cobalamin B12-binding domain-containing protein [Pseudomonadota bacterium]